MPTEKDTSELAKKQETPLAKKSVVEMVMSSDDADFIMAIRLKSQNSAKLSGEPGDYVHGNELVIGDKMEAPIGPWRLAARRFEGSKLGLQAFNRTEKSTVIQNEDDGTWVWDHPVFSANFAEIMNKDKPDDGLNCRNLDGMDVLLWVPSINKWGVYFIAAKAKSCTNVKQDVVRYGGRIGSFGSQRGPGQYNYHVPTFELVVEDAVFPTDAPEMFEKFLMTPLELLEDTGPER